MSFARFVGIDYSGAGTPDDRLAGLAVAVATVERPAEVVRPAAGRSKRWTRRTLFEWLLGELEQGPPALVGIDHALGLPLAALTGETGLPWLAGWRAVHETRATHETPATSEGRTAVETSEASATSATTEKSAAAETAETAATTETTETAETAETPQATTGELFDALLACVAARWPATTPGARVEALRRAAPLPAEASRWRRVCEVQARAKSVFHFGVPGSVAMSTFAGLPFLADLRRALGARLFVWPFDGWRPPAGCHVLVEGYPTAWRADAGASPAADAAARAIPPADEADALALANGYRLAAGVGGLGALFEPAFTPATRAVAELEGWILGVDPSAPGTKASPSCAPTAKLGR